MRACTLFGFSVILTAFIGPAMSSAAADDRELAGAYQCVGHAGNGTQYQGKVTISKEEDCFNLTWELAGARYTGIGIREGNLLSAAIRQDGDLNYMGIIVYRIENDGKFVGRWSGQGYKGKTYTETLTPENSPKPLNEEAALELDQLKGTWELESGATDGSEFVLAEVLQTQVAIDGGMWTTSIKGIAAGTLTVVIDPGSEPKTIDWTSNENQTTQLGIYKLDGDTLTVAFGAPNAKRPETFESPKGSGIWVSIYKRQR